jgi:anaerobic selenocysteine-containing dehydrogenase/Fe-S-cluster-containing dehydrogenase component
VDRRTFLKIAGVSGLSFAANCTSQPEKTLYSLVQAPDDMVTGKATWYASTCRECPAGCGVLAKNREGRTIKVEGNPLHPINRGRLCMRGQAALQGIYNPDRIKTPLLKEAKKWRPVTYAEAEAILQAKAEAAVRNGNGSVRMLTEVVGESLLNLASESLKNWGSEGPVIFEPFGYEALKEANSQVFGVDGLPSYKMDEADFLISFGADFLETWLSPVEYARKFKNMHGLRWQNKSLYFHVSPYQSLTGANADFWFSCNPESEHFIALGLLREGIRHGNGRSLPDTLRTAIDTVSSPYTRERVFELSGLPPELFDKLYIHLQLARKPLILGTSTSATGANSLQTNIAVNLLNLVFDPDLELIDFSNRHRVETANRRATVLEFFKGLHSGAVNLLLLNNVNPVFALPPGSGVREALERDSLFVVSFSSFMDETTELADLILPVCLPLETWDEYGGKAGIVSTLQPTMGSLTGAPNIGDLLLRASFGPQRPVKNFQAYLFAQLTLKDVIGGKRDWLQALQKGGLFQSGKQDRPLRVTPSDTFLSSITTPRTPKENHLVFFAVPSIRFFDGRGANRPWLCEVPDTLTQVAWQTPVLMHPKTLAARGLKQGDIVQIESRWGQLQMPVYETVAVHAKAAVMSIGQGHSAYGRYARGRGLNPIELLSPELEPNSGGPFFAAGPVALKNTGRSIKLAHTDGSRDQHERKIALSVQLKDLANPEHHHEHGLGMWEFPLVLPLPEAYDRKTRDIYPPHQHEEYRWAMVVDLDKCIGCSACAAACYAENNVAVAGEERIVEGREMAWLQIQRYEDPEQREKITFLPMLCQHCDNAPCESVCPVYAPHHSKEGLNNQIYNRCIGTRFCSQDCPYKVRRFNWFLWEWPEPLNLQLNPDVTVRFKGVMEKCSFCIQRIKDAHNTAKNEGRKILDGEIQPACLQTCPTGAFTFGNLMDKESEVRKKVEDQRAYQVMGYLNTKPAVIYLKKVVQDI